VSRSRSTGTRRYDVAFYAPAIGPLFSDGNEPFAGGAESQVYLVARSLVQRGLRVCVVTFDVPGARLASVDGIEVVARPRYSRGRGLVARLREGLAIGKAVSQADARLFVARSAGPAAGVVALSARIAGRRFIYSSSSDADFGRLEARAANRRLVHLALRLANHVVVQNEFQRRVCADLTTRPIAVIRSIAEAAPLRTATPDSFLWVGRPISYKRPLAFVELARALPEALFVMVVPTLSTRPELDLSVEVASASRDVPNLRLLGAQGKAELAALVERAVAVVNTSEFEGMPNMFLESWARGVPALALAHDPDGVIERHSLGVFAHGSWDDFVAAARALWDGRSDLNEPAARCRRYVADEHSPETISDQWMTVLGLGGAVAERSALAEVA
jgi:glycosyltransferase involved in cell wall biosynthesis